jgi:hypothetical protein
MPSEISADKLRGVLEIVRLANVETDLGALMALITQPACSLLEADRGTLIPDLVTIANRFLT